MTSPIVFTTIVVPDNFDPQAVVLSHRGMTYNLDGLFKGHYAAMMQQTLPVLAAPVLLPEIVEETAESFPKIETPKTTTKPSKALVPAVPKKKSPFVPEVQKKTFVSKEQKKDLTNTQICDYIWYNCKNGENCKFAHEDDIPHLLEHIASKSTSDNEVVINSLIDDFGIAEVIKIIKLRMTNNYYPQMCNSIKADQDCTTYENKGIKCTFIHNQDIIDNFDIISGAFDDYMQAIGRE